MANGVRFAVLFALLAADGSGAIPMAYSGELTIRGGHARFFLGNGGGGKSVGQRSGSLPPGSWGTVELAGVAELTPSGALMLPSASPDPGVRTRHTGLFPTPATNPGGRIPVFIKTTRWTAANDAGTLMPSGVGNSFGGVMRLIGQRHEIFATWPNGMDFLTFPIPLAAIGGPTGETAASNFGIVAATLRGNPWRTGAVTVSETRGAYSTYLAASGYDGRSAGGAGTLQLISPIAVDFGGSLGSGVENHTVGIAHLTLRFRGECGDGSRNFLSEQCDDGNLIDGDGCDSNCTVTACGNGIVTVPEECDDGNTTDLDRCSASCIDESFAGEVELRVRLDFARAERDKLVLKAKGLAFPPGFSPAGAIVRVDVGGSTAEYELGPNGRARSARGDERIHLWRGPSGTSFKLKLRRKRQTLAPAFEDEGLLNEDVPRPGVGVDIGVGIGSAGASFFRSVPLTYKAKQGRHGFAR